MALERYYDPFRSVDLYSVHGWGEVRVIDDEARRAFASGWPGSSGYARMVQERLLPFFLLSTPGHEGLAAWG